MTARYGCVPRVLRILESEEEDAMSTPEVIGRRDTTSLARLDPQALIAKAIETGAGIEMMERLVALAKDVREVQAREAWYAAMAEFQRGCPAIKKTGFAKIQTARASYEYRYAPLDEILSTIQPIMGPLGLSVSWRNRVEGDKVIASCRISHTLGHHEESGELSMPIVLADADRGANPMQRVGIATTYAKRYSLLSIIGMAPEDDDDAQTSREAPPPQRVEDEPPAEGRTINEGQQKRLWAIARHHGWSQADVKDLIAGWQCESTHEIPVAFYDAVIDKLKARQPK